MRQLPSEFLNSLSNLPGFDERAFVEAHEADQQPVSVRMNPFKNAEPAFGISSTVPWNNHAFYLTRRPYFTHDPLFHAGCYYVQEAASMFIGQALEQTLDLTLDIKILDACAAPGGKSTLINSLITPESLLVANEIIKNRSGILAQNLSRWGTHNTIVTCSGPEKFSNLQHYFDAMVVDAPCSGSGLFRKQPEAIDEWSLQSVAACSHRQKDILEKLLPALRPGGILVYSTCSYSSEENEQITEWLINEKEMSPVVLSLQKDWNITETALGLRFYPHLTRSEGFFCAVLQKKESDSRRPRAKTPGKKTPAKESKIMAPYLQDKEHEIYQLNNRNHLMNAAAAAFTSEFGKQFYIRKAGTALGEIKGHDFIPSQELAWSIYLEKTIPRAELDLETAIRYLKKENPSPGNFPAGIFLASFQNYGLGWAKNLGNRVNNYLPDEIKILK